MSYQSLTRTLPLAIALFLLVSYNFISAQWTNAPASPPLNNAAIPVNLSATNQVKLGGLGTGALGVFGDIGVTDSSPSVLLSDTNGIDMWLYNNASWFYLLTDRNSDGAWDAPFPLQIFSGSTSSLDWARFSNQIRVNEYCNFAGGDCFSPAEVTTINTSTFINTSTTPQTKAGNLTLGSGTTFTAPTVTATTRVNTANLCDAAGLNCTAPAAILNTSITAQAKAGTLTAGNLFTAGNVRTTNVCDAAGANCKTPASILDTTATAQTKTGPLTATGGLNAPTITASTRVRSNEYCDAAGNNCTPAANLRGPSCTQVQWNQGLELTPAEKPDGNRYMVMPESVSRRCQQLGYDFGFSDMVFSPQNGTQGWCGFGNARTAQYENDVVDGNKWVSNGCVNYSVAVATCCSI